MRQALPGSDVGHSMGIAWRLCVCVSIVAGGCTTQSVRTGDPVAHMPTITAPEEPNVYRAQLLRAEMMAELTNYYRDFSNRDWSRFASHFWPGATITTIWAPTGETARRVVASTVEQFVAEAALGPDSKSIFSERMGQSEIHLHGNLAMVWAHYEARFGEPGDIQRWSGYDAFTLMKHQGRWKITHLAFAAE